MVQFFLKKSLFQEREFHQKQWYRFLIKSTYSQWMELINISSIISQVKTKHVSDTPIFYNLGSL